MSVFDFITPDDLDELPHDDPPRAFLLFVRKAQAALEAQTHASSRDESWDNEEWWRVIHDAQHTFVNVVTAAARTYAIEPLSTTAVPTLKSFGDSDYREFVAELDHYLTQLLLQDSMRVTRESAQIPQTSKDKIRSYLHALRDCVEKANLSDAKREQLLKKIDAFSAELEKRRLSARALTQLMVAIAVVPGGLWGSGQAVMHVVGSIAQVFGEAKLAEDESRQPRRDLVTRYGVRRGRAIDASPKHGDER